ncbi:hypothetical protein SESBI_17190 [Sesbania bispinosa]|nr:hypothetical protein SESBI_17190 [Sesbania bispinosa]
MRVKALINIKKTIRTGCWIPRKDLPKKACNFRSNKHGGKRDQQWEKARGEQTQRRDKPMGPTIVETVETCQWRNVGEGTNKHPGTSAQTRKHVKGIKTTPQEKVESLGYYVEFPDEDHDDPHLTEGKSAIDKGEDRSLIVALRTKRLMAGVASLNLPHPQS